MGKTLNEYIQIITLPVGVQILLQLVVNGLALVGLGFLGMLAWPINLLMSLWIGYRTVKNFSGTLINAVLAGGIAGIITGITGVIISVIMVALSMGLAGDIVGALIGAFVVGIIGLIIGPIVGCIFGAIVAAIGAFITPFISKK